MTLNDNSVGRGDSSHSPFQGEKTWKSKNG